MADPRKASAACSAVATTIWSFVVLEPLLVGWVQCPSGRDELVAISTAERDELAKGALPCPACGKRCGAPFEPATLSADVKLLRWTGTQWRVGFLLGED